MELTIADLRQCINVLPGYYMIITFRYESWQVAAYSSSMPEFFGMTAEEFEENIQKSVRTLIFSSDQNSFFRILQKNRAEEKAYDHIFRIMHKDKGPSWVKGSLSFHKTIDGETFCCINISKENTGSALSQDIIENSPLAICALDMYTGEILHVNEGYAQMAKQPREACIGRTISQVTGLHKDLRVVDICHKTVTYYVPEDNRVIEITGKEATWDDSREVIIVYLNDITEQRRETMEAAASEAEQELKMALAEAKKANHAKSDFLSSMSHDIRTPLNAIINLTSLLHEELEDPEKLEADIQKIEVAGEFLLQLINDILDVSAIESGKLQLVPRVYTYATFLNYIKGIIVPLCDDKDIHFVLDEGPTALDIYMDRVRFHQVFFNILSNAVKYTAPGGTVTFRTTNNVVHDGILTCDFVISDTGCGMSEEFMSKVFEPFEREDTQNAYIGTGLGLTICKKILDMMGGTISIESEKGVGTTVTVHMDLQIATEEQRIESQVELDTSYNRHVDQKQIEDCRILVVEDNGINREILTRQLEKKNFVVECAKNGQEAVDLVEGHPGDYYQLVLMDVRMPVMDGLQATALIRANADVQKSRIPIIAITANAFEEDVKECMQAGMNAYLSKPISFSALFQMVATYVSTSD